MRDDLPLDERRLALTPDHPKDDRPLIRQRASLLASRASKHHAVT